MKWAVTASVVIHIFFIGLIFSSSESKTGAYPKVIPVILASLPPNEGTTRPAVAEETVSKAPKNKQKIEPVKDKTRVAEVNKDKRSEKKKTPEPKPVPQDEEDNSKAKESKNRGLPEGVKLGSEFGSARLDAVGFDSPYFLNVLFSKIRNNWDNPYEGADSIGCIIYFVVDRKGKIVDSAIEKPSGLDPFDQSALRAVLAAKPPPLPNQFNSDELGIHLEFKYLPYN